MNIKDVENSVTLLNEIRLYLIEELDKQIPIDIAVQLKRYIRNIDEVIQITECGGDS